MAAVALAVVMVVLLGTRASRGASRPRDSHRGPEQLHSRALVIPGVAWISDEATQRGAVYVAAQPWKWRPGQVNRMYMGVVSRWRPRQLKGHIAAGEENFVSVSSDWMAWTEGGSVASYWRVYVRSRETGRIRVIDGSNLEGPNPVLSAFPMLSLSGDRVAWSYVVCHGSCARTGRGWTTRISIENLRTGRSRVVASTSQACLAADWVSLWGNTLAFQEEGTCPTRRGSDIYAADLGSGRVRRLTRDGQSSDPATNGRYVAFKYGGNRFNNGVIELLDLRTGRVRPISLVAGRWASNCFADRGHRIDKCTDGNGPVISSDIVAWQTAGDMLGRADSLMARDLRTGRQYVLAPGLGSLVPWRLGEPWGHQAVWIECHGRHDPTACNWVVGTAVVP
jgi:hypothetical protein